VIAEIVITVADVDEATSFYTESVGLAYLKRVRVDGTAVVLLAAGSTRVALVPGPTPSIRLALASDDVAADHRRLGRRGVEVGAEPVRAGGGTVLPFADPWGNPLAFWEASPPGGAP
jgi:predicted enzyme related to lactoylglutathione lyase